jgi:hypothetical protein
MLQPCQVAVMVLSSAAGREGSVPLVTPLHMRPETPPYMGYRTPAENLDWL